LTILTKPGVFNNLRRYLLMVFMINLLW